MTGTRGRNRRRNARTRLLSRYLSALGKKGGRARAATMTKREHVALARKAARTRWAREKAKQKGKEA